MKPNKPSRGSDLWESELRKFLAQDVEVVTAGGEKFEANCRAIHFQSGAVVLMTDTEKILVCGVSSIRRSRTDHEKQGENQ